MTDVDALHLFRIRATGPSPLARSAALNRLQDAIRLETGAVALPTAHAGQARARFRRRWLLLAGTAAVCTAVAVALVSTLGGAPGTLEQAQAALRPDGRILHVVVRIVEPKRTTRAESWVLADGSLGHSVTLSGGPRSDCLGTSTELRCWDSSRRVIDVYRYNPAAVEKGQRASRIPQFSISQPESMSRALESGYARIVGSTEIEGRQVYAVRLAVPRFDAKGNASPLFLEGMSPTLFIDRKTSYPVAERFPDSGSTTYYDTFEFLSDTPDHRSLLELDAPADAPVVVHPAGEGPQG
jgi:hypothetical protein